MAISKIILNGVTQMDLTGDTVEASNLIAPNTAHGADGEAVVGTATGGSSALIIMFSQNETTGYWTPDKTFAEIQSAYNNGQDIVLTSVIDSCQVSGGYDNNDEALYYVIDWWDYTTEKSYANYYIFNANGVTDDGGAMINQPTGTKNISITQNGTTTEDVADYASAQITVNVPSSTPNLQNKTVSYTPTESAQSNTVSADSGYDGLGTVSVNVGAISSTYVGSGITRRDDTDLSVSGATVTVPSGYYAAQETKDVSTTTHPNPTVSVNSSGLITASHTQGTGYVTGGTTTGTHQLTTDSGSTITPSTSSQTVSVSGKYMTGNVVVNPIPSQYVVTTDATAAASDIVSGATAYVGSSKVTGTLVIQHYYTGSGDPSASTGENGDIYLKVVS